MPLESNPPDPQLATTAPRGAYARLFTVSFLILFFELAAIRWFGSTVIFLTFFTNLVLMACFLGMSVGCLAASRKTTLLHSVIPLTLLATVMAAGVHWGYERFTEVTIDVGRQQSPQQIFFGAETRPADPSRFVIPIEIVAGTFFLLIALMFVGLGQEMGRCFAAIPSRVGAYTADILGSLTGIAAFGAASALRTPPPIWFALALGLCVVLLRRSRMAQGLAAAAAVGVVAVASDGTLSLDAWLNPRKNDPWRIGQTVWSPYYKVDYVPAKRVIKTNNISHQGMITIPASGMVYALPHLLNRDAGRPPFQDVMVIGAGSGNDVRAALAYGAKHVDAVEIDPVLNELGRLHHPDRPYDDPRVTIHLDDGRNFTKKTEKKYDLIIYALVDSLVLHSGYSSLRLESFLFTEEAFREIRSRLKPGGLFVMYNYYRQGWVVGRLDRLAREVFGQEPLILSVPPRDVIAPGDNLYGFTNYLMIGDRTETDTAATAALPAIREAFRGRPYFHAYQAPALNQNINGYAKLDDPVPRDALKIGPARVDRDRNDLVPTDDWPFLYLKGPVVPDVNLRGIGLVLVLSTAILLVFAPVRSSRPDWQMFFLGAGFMLLETKGVVHMALLFGSTWVVNSIVFFAILTMVLLSNLFVLVLRPRVLWPYYAGLFLSLGVNAVVPMSVFLGLDGPARVVLSCAVVFIPVFFAGVVFAALFQDRERPDVAFGSNIGGVILGGLSENLSLLLGFNNLILVALAFYAMTVRRRN